MIENRLNRILPRLLRVEYARRLAKSTWAVGLFIDRQFSELVLHLGWWIVILNWRFAK